MRNRRQKTNVLLSHGRSSLGGLLRQEPGIAAAAQEAHAALLPELRHRERPHVDSRGDAVLEATVADLLDGFHHLGVIELAGHAERDGEVRRTDHHRVDAWHQKQLIEWARMWIKLW